MKSRVALDAMGGDNFPRVPVEAAIAAVTTDQIPVTLIGDSTAIAAVVGNRELSADLFEIVDAPDVVNMEDEAASAVRRKRRASIPVSLELLKSGAVDAFVSAGNTGAVVATSVLSLGRLAGVSRPGIAIPIPNLNGHPTLLIDAGALVDSREEHLWQHARLASAYAAAVDNRLHPRVGLISNGEEASKGTALVKAVHKMLSEDPSINFVGNVESRSLPHGVCDIAVTDGFTGNIILKTGEGIVSLMEGSLRAEFKSRWYTAILAMLLRPAFRRAGRALDYREYGGAPLLGVEGLVFIAHGSSDEFALLNAIRAAERAAQQRSLAALQNAFASPIRPVHDFGHQR